MKQTRRSFLRYLGLAGAVSVTPFIHCTIKKPGLPNVIYILADDLGYGDLGCYGQDKIKTPNLDRIAQEGMRFTQHYAGSTVCAPSRCSLMTGKHVGHATIRGNVDVLMKPDEMTVAKLMKSRLLDRLYR